MKKLLTLMLLATVVFAGCKKENDTNSVAISDNIIGKWMKADINGQPAPTNEKKVYTFVSTTRAFVSASLDTRPELGTLWSDRMEADVVVSGNIVTLTVHPNEHQTGVEEFTVTDINDSEFTANRKLTVTVDGNVVVTEEENLRFVKVTQDYTLNVLGIWEGHVTSEQSEYDDNLDHRWRYNNDGSYVYYNKDGDSWIPNPTNTLNEYFVDGKLLCMRWINNGTEYREWWEIASIENNVMNWTALRKNDDGTTYTASFSMLKVIPEGYVDLGLPSGTLWKTENEPNPADSNDFFTYDEAVATFGSNLPVKLQMNELIENCQWSFENGNAIATGPNGNTMVLPLLGKRSCNGNILGVNENASYWSKTAIDDEYAYRLDINPSNIYFPSSIYVYDGRRCAGASVRLVF